MKRLIEINQGVIGGEDKETIVEILPQLENSFRQRKQYWEYYFDNTEVTLTLEDIDKLSNEFEIVVYYETLIINVR